MPDLLRAFQAARELGLSQALLYARYEAARRLGILRRQTPALSWEDRPLERWMDRPLSQFREVLDYQQGARFFWDPVEGPAGLALLPEEAGEDAVKMGEAILEGRFRLFGRVDLPLGFPPDWENLSWAYPDGGPDSPTASHWTVLPTSGSCDYRLAWELSRFSWGFQLVRAYRWSGEGRFAQGFFHLLDDWRTAHPPNQGLQWMSGQEVGIRLLGLIFAWFGFFPWLQERLAERRSLAQSIAFHADRIPPTLSYARAQRNNHLVSEAVALYSAGLLFPVFKGASSWRRIGWKWLNKALEDQILPDGGYIQHSCNYHRLALQLALWGAGLAERNGQPLSPALKRSLNRSVQCLGALMAGKSGEVPNFGHNDGSFLLPLSACAYRDYRPTLQAGERTFAGRSSLPPGRWDELSHWLGLTGVADGGRNAAAGAPRAKGSDPGEPLTPGGTGVPSPSYPEAGLYLLKGGETWGLLRCVDFRSRPAHSDQLHLDIWWKGLNIARDPGTFRYAADSPWDNGLSAARVHNTVLVGGQDPMERAGRFLWLGWSEGRLLNRWRSTAGELEALIAQHNGYRRWDVVHRRSVLRWSGGVWVVVDDVLGEGSWPLQLTWSLPDWPFQVEGDRVAFDTPQGGIHVELSGESLQLGVYRQGELQWGAPVGNGGSRFGWWSPTYSELEPSLTLLLHGQGDLPKRMVTRWELEGDGLRSLEVKWHRLGENELPWARVRGREEQLHFEIAGGGG